jgi:glycosyltransferase involved in cell wall biosynthesis
VILEAMSVGVPVVTTPVAGIPEVVRHRESGLLVQPRDDRGLADAIEQVLSDDSLRARLVAGGARAAEDFRLHECVASLRRLFRYGVAGA